VADTQDFLAHLTRESQRFALAIDVAPAGATVPTCPGWDADDLLWHLAEVQWFWGTIVRERIDGSRAEQLKPGRPADRAALRAFFDESSEELGRVLADTPPDTSVWTWSDDQTAGFVRRRQAHEALIHRVDAELAAGSRTPMDPVLCADGVDEVLRVMYGGAPPWGTFTPDDDKTVRLRASDTGDSWLVTLGRFTGSEPDGSAAYEDEQDMRVAAADSGQPAAVTITAAAADLNCELWHRPTISGQVERAGDDLVLAEFDATIAPGIN
jgi:uncharacterized protein (TIGR03083 family)